MSKETIYVTTSLDLGPGSLREAINQANLHLDQVTKIIIKPCVGNHIKLTTGELKIVSDIKLLNNTGGNLTISSETVDQRIFNISQASKLLSIKSSKGNKIILNNGRTNLLEPNGGAIYIKSSSTHELLLNDVTISNNEAIGSGGGIYTSGRVTMVSSSIKNNKAGAQGGGIWSALGVVAIKSNIKGNKVTIVDDSSGGGGIYVDNGDCLLNESSIVNNHVAYDLLRLIGGSGGGLIVVAGTIYIQNNSHVDHNTAYNSAGIQEGVGNIYITNNSSANDNQSFNSGNGSSGGGGVTMTLGTVYISNSEVCDNKTVGMYSGGIVTLIGSVIVNSQSKISRNSNRGPGGGIAVNLGSIVVDSQSYVCGNMGASLGGGIVCFTPNPGTIAISKGSHVSDNILTNAQTIAQTFESFLFVLIKYLTAQDKQARLNGGGGATKFIEALPDIILQLTKLAVSLNDLPINEIGPANSIGGGGIACLSTTEIIVNNSHIENNLSGQCVDETNYPFTAVGGGIFGFNSKINIQLSEIKNNTSLSSGTGIWSGYGLNVSNSQIIKNKMKNEGNGGGIFNGRSSLMTLIDTKISDNVAKGLGGGVYSVLPFIEYHNEIINNKPNNLLT